MTHLVVLEAGQKRVFSIENTCAWRDVLRDLVDGIRFMRLTRCQIRFGILHQLRQIGFVKRFDARGQRRVAQNEYRRAVFARDACRFERDVEAIFHARWREHYARTVAVTAKDRLMQIALLDIGGQTSAWATALNVANDDRNLGHRRPADRGPSVGLLSNAPGPALPVRERIPKKKPRSAMETAPSPPPA